MFSCRSTSSCKIATCTERMKNESHPLVPRLRYAARRGRARKVALFYTKWGNQSQRKQPRYVSGDLALLQTGTRYLAFPSLGVNVQPSSLVGQTGWTSELELPFLRIFVHSLRIAPIDIDRANRACTYISSILCKSIEIFQVFLDDLREFGIIDHHCILTRKRDYKLQIIEYRGKIIQRLILY